MKTKKCECCGKELECTRSNFKSYSYPKNNDYFHPICKKCEEEEKRKREWKDDKLLCHICGKYLSVDNFQQHPYYSYRNHHEARCRQCKNKQMENVRKNLDDKTRLQKTLRMRFYAARDRARKKSLSFDLTTEFLEELWCKQEGKCAITNIPMTYLNDNGRTYTNVSIDRIDSNKGYTKENVQLVCMAVNQMKSDLTMDEVLIICEAVVKNNKILH